MKGEKQITFPFEFKYSDGGTFKTEFGVTVRAPSLDQFKVHSAMTAFAKSAQIGTAVAFSGMKRDAVAQIIAAEVSDELPEESEDDAIERAVSVFASGLGPEKFPDFMDYLRKTIVNNPRLATIGDTKIPITDLTMQSIADAGGMNSVNQILMSFAGFFLTERPSKSASASGTSMQHSPPSAVGVH